MLCVSQLSNLQCYPSALLTSFHLLFVPPRQPRIINAICYFVYLSLREDRFHNSQTLYSVREN